MIDLESIKTTEHVIPYEVTHVAPSRLERATEWLATSGMVIALASLVVAALTTMGAR